MRIEIAGPMKIGLLMAAIFGGVACQSNSPMDTANLMAKIAVENNGKSICAKGKSMSDLSQALYEYSQAHPEKGDRLSDKDIHLALARKFPC